jgi:hypothetical protein
MSSLSSACRMICRAFREDSVFCEPYILSSISNEHKMQESVFTSTREKMATYSLYLTGHLPRLAMP